MSSTPPRRAVVRPRRWWVPAALVAALGLTAFAPATTGPAAAEDRSAAVRATERADRPTRFTVSTFNVLGFRHTEPGGSRARKADGRQRMVWTVDLLRDHGVDVVGFQELQPEQFEKFNELTGAGWNLYPGDTLDRIEMHNSIAWRTRMWELVKARSIRIPYFEGELVRMPVVWLRHRNTGQVIHFANFHNPADAHGPAQRYRNQALAKQIDLANRKHQNKKPLIITGDMNERDPYFCGMTAGAPMRAANGGSNRKGRCETPPRPMPVDWIFGHKRFDFGGYEMVTSRKVRKTSDHPFIVADAELPAG